MSPRRDGTTAAQPSLSKNAPTSASNGVRAFWIASLIAATLVLGGCAARQAYREGIRLSEAGDQQGALRSFEAAVSLDNGSALYRMAAIHARDSLARHHRQTFERHLEEGKAEEAEAMLDQHLLQSADAGKLRSQLRTLQASQRHADWLQQANDQVKTGATDQARATARKILLENPQHAQASRLLSSLEKQGSGDTGRSAALDKAYKTPITIEFKDAQIKTVFEVISRTSGLNFVFDKDVRADQKTSIFLKNATVEAAIHLTLLTNQLNQRVLDSNSILIYPNNQAKLKDYQPLSVKVFYLSHAEAKSVANTLKTILKTRDLVVDDKLNMIVLRDTPEAVRLAEKLVAVHDVADPEVMLEVEILEVNRSRLLNLGVRWPDQIGLTPLAADGTNLTLADLWSATRDRRGRTIGAAIGSTSIHAGKTDSDSDILANPRIRVRNRDKARILIGDRVPNITSTSTSTGFVAESVNYVDVGLKLQVEPVISIDGEVAIKVDLEVSNIVEQLTTKAGSIAYRIGTRSAQTVLQLRDGENQVLAGLINHEDRTSANKVPGLGELPVAGRLFGNQVDNNNRTEIVLSITPRILRNVTRPQARSLEFESGTDASLSGLPTPSIGPSAAGAPSAGQSINDPGQNPAQQATPGTPASGREPASTTSGAYQLRWIAPTEVAAGETFSVQLSLQTDARLVSVPLSLGFTPGSIQVVSVQEGGLLRQGGTSSSFAHRVDPSGQILITTTRSGSAAAATDASSSGTLATITFRAIPSASQSEARLQILAAAPVATGGRALTAPLPQPHDIAIKP